MAACVAQSSLLLAKTIPISDDSSSGSPVALKGTVTFDGENADNVTCSVTGHNNSPKSVIAYTFELDMTRPSGEPAVGLFQYDRFLKKQSISLPHADFPVFADCKTGHELDIVRTPAPPEAHAKLLFVQYEDGSVWGNDKTTAEIMAQRSDVVAYLQSLKAAYSSGGLDALAQALAREQPFSDNNLRRRTMVHSRQQTLRYVRDTEGIRAVANTIDENLAMAKLHEAALLKR